MLLKSMQVDKKNLVYKQKENRDTKMNKIILTKEIGKEKIREELKQG